MKKLFVSVLAIAAAVACNNSEIVSMDKGEAIQFGNAFVNNSTRADDPSYSANDINNFLVYGTANNVVIYPGATVTKTDDYGKAWSCTYNGNEIKQYWIANADYKFVGIVDGAKTNVTETTIVDGMPTEISYTADGETDLLCQTITRKNDTSIVAFDFAHLLSKVNFTVTNKTKDAAGYSFVVKNINFKGNTVGVYDVVNGGWNTEEFESGDTAVGNERTVNSEVVKDIVVASGVAKNELSTEVLFLPGEYKITFTVDILYNGDLVTTTNYPAEGAYTHTLVQANAYNFNVDVAVGKLIEFTVAKQPEWGNGNTGDSNADDVMDYVPLQ